MNRLKLTIATTDYDHFRDFRTGAVQAEGIEHIWLTLGHHEIFSRFTFNREWDVPEVSFAIFTAQVPREKPAVVGVPVCAHSGEPIERPLRSAAVLMPLLRLT